MKWYLLFLVFLLTIALSCKKENKNPNGNISTQQDLFIKKVVFTSGYISNFEYYNDNRINKIITTDTNSPNYTHTTEFTYDEDTTTTHDFYFDGLVISKTYHLNDTLIQRVQTNYDGAGGFSTIRNFYFDGGSCSYVLYETLNPGLIYMTSVEYIGEDCSYNLNTIKNGDPFSTETSIQDGENYVYKSLQSFQGIALLAKYFKGNTIESSVWDADGNLESHHQYEYEYNSENYPISQFEIINGVPELRETYEYY